MIKFGLFPPTQIVNHGDEVHIELVKSKKASQRAYAKAKKERCSLVAVARDLLANDMKSKTDATEVLLGALDQAKDDLRQKILEARKARLPNSLRNFRRKYARTEEHREKIASRVAAVEIHEDGSCEEIPHDDLFPRESAKHPAKAKSLIRMVIREYLHKQHLPESVISTSLKSQRMEAFQGGNMVTCFHISANGGPSLNTGNQFSVLSSKAPAPHSRGLQQQLQQLQAQMDGIRRQIQPQEVPEGSRSRGRMNLRRPNWRPHQDRRVWAPRGRVPPPRNAQPNHNWNRWARHQEYHPPPTRQVYVPRSQPQNNTQAPLPMWQVQQRNPALLPTPPIRPRVWQGPSATQQRRERRRRSREAMYRELQDLVLRHVQVRVRADGRIYPDNEKISLRVSPRLQQNERYSYLIECLAPRPRQVESAEILAPNSAGGTQKVNPSQEQSVAPEKKNDPSSETPMEVDEQLPANAVDVSTSTNYETASEGEGRKKPSENMVMCGMIEVHLNQDADLDWKPPIITQKLTYPSDEEIVPNPQIMLGARYQLGTSQAPDSFTA